MPLFTRNIPPTDATTEEPSSEPAAEPVTEAADTAVADTATEELPAEGPPVKEATAEAPPAEQASAAEAAEASRPAEPAEPAEASKPDEPSKAAAAAKPAGAAEPSRPTEARKAAEAAEASRPTEAAAAAAKPAEADEPSRPAAAAEAADAAEARKPAEPDEHNKPAEPAEAAEAAEASRPAEAAEPAEATEATEATEASVGGVARDRRAGHRGGDQAGDLGAAGPATEAAKPAQADEASRPAEPTEAAEASKPTEVAEAAEHNKPTAAAEASVGGVAAKPAEAAEASKPAEPAEPAEASKPTEPAEPAQASKPTEPAEPSKPAEATEASKPNRPAEAAKPAEAMEAAEATKPAQADEASRPAEAAEPTEAAEASKSAEPDQPSKPTEAAEAAEHNKPTAAAEAADAAEAAKPAEPAEASKSAEPDQPSKSAEHADAAEPSKPAAPQESTGLTAPADGPKPDWRTRRPAAARNVRWAVTALSAGLVLVALQMPNTLGNLRISEFFRLPAEAIVGAVVLLAMPRRARVVTAAGIGVFLGALTVLNLLDIGFVEYLGRHFNLVLDWQLLADAQSYLTDTIGTVGSIAATLAVIVLAVLLPVVTALATVRLSGLLARNNTVATKATLVAGTVWITSMSLGLTIGGVPIASDHTAGVVKVHARRASDTFRDEAAFERFAKKDPFANTPGDELVPDLRGKDVIVTFIESYGRSAIEDPVMAPGVGETLADGTQALTDARFAAKSGWLTSATYGGSSWLGHSTFLSGLWINNQQRYNTLVNSDRLTLTEAFRRTGAWRTVGVMPGVQKRWPEEEFYGLEKNYESKDLGYKGPKFSWSTMPDQYTLEAFQRLEHGRKSDKPLMSEIILTSSHQPWAPLPKTVPQDQLGDGSVFEDIQKAGKNPKDVLYDETQAKQEYGKSIQYSVTSVVDWMERYGTDDTVLVLLGDHQPMSQVSGANASHDVPISIVAKDPKVLDKITDWNWSDGLRPTDEAPVWKMSAFRDKFLTAYGSTPHP